MDSPYAGAVWETFVCAELRKKLRASDRGDLFYWSDRTREADFLIHKAGTFELLDAKWAVSPDRKGARTLMKVADFLPPNSVRRMALVCRTPHAYPLYADVYAVPVKEA